MNRVEWMLVLLIAVFAIGPGFLWPSKSPLEFIGKFLGGMAVAYAFFLAYVFIEVKIYEWREKKEGR